MGYLAVVSCIKWEWFWLLEWIEYHRLVGVEKFYLYANEEPKHFEITKKVVQPLIDEGVVDLVYRPGKQQLIEVYNEAPTRLRGQYRWLAVIDPDEFLLPLRKDSVAEMLRDYEHHDVIGVNWRCFGSNGHVTRPESQIRAFTKCSSPITRAGYLTDRHTKVILNPVRNYRFLTPHHVDFTTVDEQHKVFEGPWNPNLVAQNIVLNHYVVRSREDFLVKNGRGCPITGIDNPRNEFFWNACNNAPYLDETIVLRFADKVKSRVTRIPVPD